MPRLSLLIVLSLAPLAAHAEVMDKESSATALWLWTLIPAAFALLAARYRPWFLLLVLPAPLLFFAAQIAEVSDPQVGPDILREAGPLYIAVSWGGLVVLAATVLAGLWWRRRKGSAPNNSFKPKPLRGSA
jgi:hypothetical protein